MGAETVDTTAFADAMKTDYYKSVITSQLNNEQKLVSIFTTDSEGFDSGGNELQASIKTKRSYAVRAVGDGGILPSPKAPSYRKLIVPKKYVYGSLQVSGPSIKQSMKSEATFGRVLDEISQDLIDSVDRFRNRSLSGYGRGILALVNVAGVGTTTITVDSPGGIAGSTNGNRFLNEGMDIAICDATTGAVLAYRTVTAFNAAGTQITVNAAVSAIECPDNALIALASSDGVDVESSLDLEPMGLLGLVDDATYVATYFSLARSTNPTLNSTVIPSVGSLTAMKLQRGLDGASRKSGKTPDAYLMDHSVRREYLTVREADFRYVDDKMNPDIGYDGGALDGEVKYTKTKIIPVSDFVYGTWMGIYKGTLVRTVDSEGEWINEDGAILSRIPNRDIFQAQYRIFENYWNKQPNTGFRLDGITATVDVDHIF